MTFLNPLVLFGLAAAAIPLLLHLLNLRKLRTIQFSSLQFLTDLQRTAIRKLKIRQILLLILRTLIITSLVLAFSRPLLRSPVAGPIAARAATTMVFLLDDSPSMGIRTERGVILSEVASAALRTVASAGPEDHLCLIPLSAVRMDSSAPVLVTLPSAVRERLEEAAATPVSGTIRAGLSVAREVLARSHDPNKEMYILTDAQATQFPASIDTPDSGATFDGRMRCFLVSPAAPADDNLSAEAADVRTAIIVRNRPVTLQATVRNNGSRPVENTVASFYLDGVRVAQQSLRLPPRAAVTVTAAVIPKRAGPLGGCVALEDDPLEIDNTRYFVLQVPEKVRVLVCSPDIQDGRYVRAALTLGGDSTVAGLFSVRQEGEESFPSLDLNAFDVLVMCGLRNIRAGDASRLAQFVRSGGGVLIFPAVETALTCYNEQLFPLLRMPGATFTRISSGMEANEQRPFVSFTTVDFAHPIFAGMFEPARAGKRTDPSIQSPRIYATFAPAAGGGGHTIIGLSSGAGFLREYGYGSGRILIFAVEPGTLWSDFAVSGIYAPLLHRTVLYVASPAEPPRSFTSGDRLEALRKASPSGGDGGFLFRNPTGIDERTVPTVLPASALSLFRSSPTDTVGVYTLLRTGQSQGAGQAPAALDAFPVNVSPEESDLRTIGDGELVAFFTREGIDPRRVTRMAPSEDLSRLIQESRFGIELWKFFLALSLLLALTEMIIARDRTERRAS